MIAIGMMSGTPADAVAAAAIELDVPVAAGGVRVLTTAAAPYPRRIRGAVLALGEGGTAHAREIARLHGLLGDADADLAERVIKSLGERPDVIAIHVHTGAHLA